MMAGWRPTATDADGAVHQRLAELIRIMKRKPTQLCDAGPVLFDLSSPTSDELHSTSIVILPFYGVH